MEKFEYMTVIASISSGLLGVLIGYYVDVKKNLKKKNVDYCLEIFDIYKQCSDEITKTITPLTSLSLKHRGFTNTELDNLCRKLSDLYFKYYTYLPQPVLNEINCLHSCLQLYGKKLFCIKGVNAIRPCEIQDVIDLFDDTALVGGQRNKILEILKAYNRLPVSLNINLQARRVIRVIAQMFENRTVDSWTAILKKETLLQTRSK